jgi:N-acyl-D-aspartate/D-glutamate deacylase
VATGVNGHVVYRNGEFREGYGQTAKSGRFLRASDGTRPTADVAVHA